MRKRSDVTPRPPVDATHSTPNSTDAEERTRALFDPDVLGGGLFERATNKNEKAKEEETKPRCRKCNAEITQTAVGSFYPTMAIQPFVKAAWGQETFTPVPYNTFTVGPFEATAPVFSGEDASAILRTLQEKLAEFAKVEFERKSERFLEKLLALKKRVGG